MEKTIKECNETLQRFTLLRRSCLNRCASHSGLYAGQPPVLEFICSHAGCTQTEIAASLGVSAASIAFSTNRMQKSGFIQKQTDRSNMRRNMLYATEKGAQVLEQYQADSARFDKEIYQDLSESELITLTHLTLRINQNMEKVLASREAAS